MHTIKHLKRRINVYGEILPDDLKPVLRKEDYQDEYGNIKYGKEYSKDADDKGFYISGPSVVSVSVKSRKNGVNIANVDVAAEPAGSAFASLPPGKILIRYGNEAGHYLAELGTPYENLSLPFRIETVPFHVYVVNPDYRGRKRQLFRMGMVAPDFEQPGRGVQYYTRTAVSELLKSKYLIELDAEPYLKKKDH